jgi:hypothetical protein
LIDYERRIIMIVVVQGTNNFSDYQVFLRAIGVALSSLSQDDKQLEIYSVGPAKTNTMAMEFVNVSERSMKSRGIKLKLRYVPPSWVIENINSINYFAYLSTPSEPKGNLVKEAENNNIEVGIFKY